MIRELTPEDYDELVGALRTCRHPLPLNEEQIKALAQRALIREVLSDDIVIRQGADPDNLYFVMSGHLRVLDTSGDEPRLLNVHAPKTFVGEQGMLYEQPRAATVEAISNTKLAVWDGADFRWLLRQDDRCQPYFENLYRQREARSQLTSRHFSGKAEDEEVAYFSHRHWIAFLRGLFTPFSLVLTPLQVGPGQMPTHPKMQTALEALAVLVIIALLVGLGFLLGWPAWYVVPLTIMLFVWGGWNWIDWRNDYFIVTDKRVIRREKIVLIYDAQQEAAINQVQNTKVSRSLIGSIFGYYDLTIETAAAIGSIKFEQIPRRPEAEKILFSQMALARAKVHRERPQQIRDALRVEIEEGGFPDELDVPIPPPVPSFRERFGKGLSAFRDTVLPWHYPPGFDGEGVERWRKHWLNLLKRALLPTIFLTGTSVLLALAILGVPLLGDPPFLLGILFLEVIFGLWFWWEVDDWSNDLYIVTPTHVIDVEKKPLLLAEKRVQAELEAIQNVSFEQRGAINNMFNIGDVLIETAGKQGQLTFVYVPNPRVVQSTIFNKLDKHRQDKAEKEAEQTRQDRAKWFGIYHKGYVAVPMEDTEEQANQDKELN